jgi:heat-inducible transcriptional repressor
VPGAGTSGTIGENAASSGAPLAEMNVPHSTTRSFPRPQLSYRARKILFAVVSEYIATGEPVGSRRLSKRYGLNLSPATIRNELSDLEEAGCLAQPHTSAGRVPTETGFRVFIDALAQMREVAEVDRAAILARMGALRPGVDDVVREAGRLLASLTGAAALITRPRTELEPLSQLRFMTLAETSVLAVIVTRSGAIQNRVVTLAEPLEASELERLHNYLGDIAKDRTLAELRAVLAEAVAGERSDYDRLRVRAKQMVDAAAADEDREVIIEGQGALFDRPEFESAEKMRAFLRTFEEKERLVGLLDRTIVASGVTVLLGSEANLVDVPDIGVISASYRTGGISTGTVGIVGPTRMDYGKLMPLVGFMSEVMGGVLDGEDGDEEPPT